MMIIEYKVQYSQTDITELSWEVIIKLEIELRYTQYTQIAF